MEKPGAGYRAIVDMGSNGIRCSITDLTASSTTDPRLLPILYSTRIAISLQEAQYPSGSSNRQPLSPEIISEISDALSCFQHTCQDFGVRANNITVVATEATRTALNAEELLSAIKERLGWDVQLLSKCEEATAGAIGIATSLPLVDGLVMDLGGGSVQLTRVCTTDDAWYQKLRDDAVSLPYGAAALLKRIDLAKSSDLEQSELESEVSTALSKALNDIQIRQSHTGGDGINVYLSGGGFRGWGYLLMALRSPYPIPWINGFEVSSKEFFGVQRVTEFLERNGNGTEGDSESEAESIFRVSKRRLEQLPATQLLIKCLGTVSPKVKSVTFCQGGTQAGILFDQLTPAIKKNLHLSHPLSHAVSPYVPKNLDTQKLAQYIYAAVPAQGGKGVDQPRSSSLEFDDRLYGLITPFVQVIWEHGSLIKDIRTASCLRFPITGTVGGAAGITHFERAALALILVERWGGPKHLPAEEQTVWGQLLNIVGSRAAWWCLYIGRAGALVGEVFPAGLYCHACSQMLRRLEVVGSIEDRQISLTVSLAPTSSPTDTVKVAKRIGKLGKKKNWARAKGEEAWGLKTNVTVTTLGE